MPPTERKYINPRPTLTIEFVGEKYISRCYSSRAWRVTSRSPLSSKEIMMLRTAGFLGSGQEFTYHQLTSLGTKSNLPSEIQWPLKVEPTGSDRVECSEVDEATGKIIRSPSYNPYTGRLDEAVDMPYYVYVCEDRVDSSD